MPLPLRAVTFDCWNTLLVEADWPLAHARRVEALREAALRAGCEIPLARALAAFDAAWLHHMAQWVEGVATGAAEIAADAVGDLGISDPDAVVRWLVPVWEEASHSGSVRAVEGAVATLARLAREGVVAGLICDTGLTPGRVVRRHLDRVGLLEHLAVCVFSDEVGVPKPDPRPFRSALAALGAAPAEAAHVGDLLRTDVAGARGAGMASVRLRAVYDDPSPLPEADHVVDSHTELRRVLGRTAPPG